MAIDLPNTNLNFLDLETTGFSAKGDRIIEIYSTKVRNGIVLDTFHTLVNPQITFPRDVIYLMAVPVAELYSSPTFDEISTKLMAFLEDDIIIAHNARFDIGFLRSEFAKVGMSFKNKYCCTVKVSRILYPEYKRHGLSNIIERLAIDDELISGSHSTRHRADYDTEVMKAFFYQSINKFGIEKFSKVFDLAIKDKVIPTNMTKTRKSKSKLDFDFENVTNGPGVYMFYDEQNFPLYIGMSNNLKRRIYDHLYSTTTYQKDYDIANQVKNIKIIETAGVLGAKLREAILIKSLKPAYNKRLKNTQESSKYIIEINASGYFCLTKNKKDAVNILDAENAIDLIGKEKFIKLTLLEYVKKHGLCTKLLGLEKGNKGTPCFYYHLNHCKGACAGTITAEEYNKAFLEAFKNSMIKKWPYEGQIEITESLSNQAKDLQETFYINKWCLVESSKDDIPKIKIENAIFDHDIYKILLHYFYENKR